jgi:hypothetical protein
MLPFKKDQVLLAICSYLAMLHYLAARGRTALMSPFGILRHPPMPRHPPVALSVQSLTIQRISPSPTKLSDAPIFLGVTGLNTWGRAGTSAEAVVEAPLAPGTAVLREENVFRFQAPRIGVCRGNSGDKDARA